MYSLNQCYKMYLPRRKKKKTYQDEYNYIFYLSRIHFHQRNSVRMQIMTYLMLFVSKFRIATIQDNGASLVKMLL